MAICMRLKFKILPHYLNRALYSVSSSTYLLNVSRVSKRTDDLIIIETFNSDGGYRLQLERLKGMNVLVDTAPNRRALHLRAKRES